MDLLQLDQHTKSYSDAYASLADAVRVLNETLEAAKRAALPGIKRALAIAATRRQTLSAAIETSPHLFGKPRTFTMHGLRIGLTKGRGAIEILDEPKTIAKIRDLLPQFGLTEDLIHTKESLDKSALADLPAATLKRIGVEIADATDQVVIKPIDSDIDKLVAKLLSDSPDAE